ncbi:MAG: DNA-protecting protein DprA [Deltaproteobacteria bacterium]|nr:DNA-protecting protein DprA [Deltaproteobacteria bacterium]
MVEPLTAERAVALVGFVRARGRATWMVRGEAAWGPLEEWWGRRRTVRWRDLGVPSRSVGRLVDAALEDQVDRDLAWIEANGWRVIDPSEVVALRELPEPPVLLLARGDLGDAPRLAMVGARRASAYGLRIADQIARGVAANGVEVVSGLARGVDGAAHAGALAVGGRTLAVLGAGPDVVYPPEHAALMSEIGIHGTLLTEHLPGVPPRPAHFPRRNRILVALTQALLVVEARLKSGTLTSVRWALDLGRDVLVVPGSIESPLSEGPIQLLREGAIPVGGPDHVLEAMGLDDETSLVATPAADHDATPAEERLLTLLAGDGLDLDDLVRFSGDAPSRVLTLLLSLELRDLVVRGEGMRWRTGRARSAGDQENRGAKENPGADPDLI